MAAFDVTTKVICHLALCRVVLAGATHNGLRPLPLLNSGKPLPILRQSPTPEFGGG